MSTLLQIHTSIFGDEGQSSRLAADYVAAWQARNPQGRVIERDLAAEPIPHLDAERFTAFTLAESERSAGQQAAVALSDRLIEEIRSADVIALGLPMYNFGVPSQLKAWFDHIARAGVTFRYTAEGPVGLLGGRRLVIFATRGGQYLGTPADTQTGYVTTFFNFLGIKDVDFVYAEGLALGDDSRDAALEAARAEVQRLAA